MKVIQMEQWSNGANLLGAKSSKKPIEGKKLCIGIRSCTQAHRNTLGCILLLNYIDLFYVHGHITAIDTNNKNEDIWTCTFDFVLRRVLCASDLDFSSSFLEN